MIAGAEVMDMEVEDVIGGRAEDAVVLDVDEEGAVASYQHQYRC